MLKFEYYVELKEGYRPVMQEKEETKVRFIIEAENRATADRAVRALLKNATNIEDYSGICIG